MSDLIVGAKCSLINSINHAKAVGKTSNAYIAFTKQLKKSKVFRLAKVPISLINYCLLPIAYCLALML